MQLLTIETDTFAHANFLADFLRTVKSVKNVKVESNSSTRKSEHTKVKKKKSISNQVQEAKEKYNWTNPTRPATDEEIDEMLDRCERSPSMTLEEAKSHTLKLLNKWSKQRK